MEEKKNKELEGKVYEEKNKYFLSKHKYLELLHFCAQYYDYAADLVSLDREEIKSWVPKPQHPNRVRPDVDPVGELAAKRIMAVQKINLIEDCVKEAIRGNMDLYMYIFRNVTEGLSYEQLDKEMEIHNDLTESKFNFYRTRFFYILSKER